MDDLQSKTQKPEPILDHEDWLYIAAMVCVGGGAAFFAIGAGLLCVGIMLAAWPFLARALAGRKGPPE